MHSKVLILGLDSVNHEALAPHLAAGRMPNLQRLVAGGTSGVLMSTIPAHTAAAWTTLSTGKTPGLHGVMNFRRFDPRTQQTRLNTTQDLPHRTLWQLLDEAGLHVGVVGQPQSYPCRELKKGFAVSGFETPSTEQDFTWPPALKSEVLSRVPGFCFKSERIRDPGAGKDWAELSDFDAGLASLSEENERAHALNLHLASTRPWDTLFLYYQATDPLFHKAWQWCDPATRDADPVRAGKIDRFFARLDGMLGEILALPQSAGALTLVCSDHGHGPVHELVRVNGLLADLGYLERGGLMTQAREAWKKWRGERKGKGLGVAVNWAKTRAYMPFEAIAGFIFLNRTGREAQGTVAEGEAAALTAEIAARLAAQKSPFTGQPLFDAVKPLDACYPQRGAFDCPELFAFAARGVNFVRKLSFGPAVERPIEQHKGTHRPEGFYALHGSGVKAGFTREASIADIAPTVLAALGRPVPSDMNGVVWADAFAQPLAFQFGPPATLDASGGAAVYSSAEQAIVEQRLADLGYVD